MEPFIRNDQFNFIKDQINHLINAHTTVNDTGVISAMKSLTAEKVGEVFEELSEQQSDMLNKSRDIEDQADAVLFLSQLRAFVIPFPKINEQKLNKLFPKVKKFKAPSFQDIDRRDLSYIGWNDYGAGRKFLVTHVDGKWHGLEGSFTRAQQKNICTICNGHEKVGLFTAKVKESGDYMLKRGNYICQDSLVCNRNLMKLEELHRFVQQMKEASS
ncbi:FusB/FusC family EF-G-binding protein [Halobacillus sp. Marseille-Q1614]|uniref:FusB/FusC family EF-G-binding protein n=1 Tax=Halobacillus sp. Marseille-Q1614 TaxID=2709134 RepID=UPI001570BA25|nr:FusB/FusC family EF-G-binding protein [Halobacillus sp. Marseille-Q1614]